MRIKLLLIVLSLTILSCKEQGMNKVSEIYTLGIWTAKKGKENNFKTAWESFAKWTRKNQAGAGTACLLQDPEKPQQFISYGPWESAEAIKSWRECPEFKTFLSQARELCEELQPRTLVLVATSE